MALSLEMRITKLFDKEIMGYRKLPTSCLRRDQPMDKHFRNYYRLTLIFIP